MGDNIGTTIGVIKGDTRSLDNGSSKADSIWGFPKIRGVLFRGPHNKDYSILGSILGSLYFGKLPYRVKA